MLRMSLAVLVCFAFTRAIALAVSSGHDRHISAADLSITHHQQFLRAMEGEDLSVMAKCSAVKCRATASARQLNGAALYTQCDAGTVYESTSASFMKRARCTETFRCDNRDRTTFVETCTRKNNWGVLAPTCRCSHKRAGRHNIQLAGKSEFTRLRSVCYQRYSQQSILWLFTSPRVQVGHHVRQGFRTDLYVDEYRLSFTEGHGGRGITLDDSFCSCQQIVGRGKTVREVENMLMAFCEHNGAYGQLRGDNDVPNNSRSYAGAIFSRLTGQPVPLIGTSADTKCPQTAPSRVESDQFLAPFLQHGGYQCLPLTTS